MFLICPRGPLHIVLKYSYKHMCILSLHLMDILYIHEGLPNQNALFDCRLM